MAETPQDAPEQDAPDEADRFLDAMDEFDQDNPFTGGGDPPEGEEGEDDSR